METTVLKKEKLQNNINVSSYWTLQSNKVKGELINCILIDSLGPTKIGPEGTLEILLSFKDDYLITVVVHNKGQVYIPNNFNLFGSDIGSVNVGAWTKGMKTGYLHNFNLLRTHLKSIDHRDDRCGNNAGNSTTTRCIVNFLRQKVGCHLPIHNMETDGLPTCHELDQFNDLLDLGYQLENNVFTETQMFKVTGCLSPCEKEGFPRCR